AVRGLGLSLRSIAAVAIPDVRTSSAEAPTPRPASLVATSAGVPLELFVKNRTGIPSDRTPSSASGAAATAWSPRYTTPSRSTNKASYRVATGLSVHDAIGCVAWPRPALVRGI